YAVGVLPAGRLRLEKSAERIAVRRRWVFPIGPDRSPAVAEALHIGVAVLRDDGCDALRMAHGKPETRRCAVVEDIDGKAIEPDDFGEALNHLGDIVEGIFECIARRHVGLAESGKVRSDYVKSVGKHWDQIAEHMTRARKAVQQ